MRGAVIAGGNASRFGGRPKGLESVGGRRMLDRVVDALAAATGTAPLLVANAPDASRWRPDLTVQRDVLPDCGSLGGIYTAVVAAADPVLVLAWDMPFVPIALLNALVHGADGHDVFLPETGEGVEPLCAVYGPACASPIRRQLERRAFRASGFHDVVDVARLPAAAVAAFGSPDMLFFNVNTPADLARAEALWRQRA